MMPMERDETLAMVWPSDGELPPARATPSYSLSCDVDEASFRQVQASIGFEVTDAAWRSVADDVVSDRLVVARLRATGDTVAVAAALTRVDGWAELAWVAVAPGHRGAGLGWAVCHEVVRRVAAEIDGPRLFGSTQDYRLSALHIYLSLGFHPVYRAAKVDRWRAVCERLGVAYRPVGWGWERQA